MGRGQGLPASGSIHVYTSLGAGGGESITRGRPQTAEASFRLVLSLQRCRMRSALGLGGTAGCGLGRSVSGCCCSPAGGQHQVRPARPALHRLASLFGPHPHGPAPDPASITAPPPPPGPAPSPRPALTQGAPGTLRSRPLAAALLRKTDTVAPIGVLTQALP